MHQKLEPQDGSACRAFLPALLEVANERALALFEQQPAAAESLCSCLRVGFKSMDDALRIIAASEDGQRLLMPAKWAAVVLLTCCEADTSTH